MHVVIFEGRNWTTFAPLALSKPTFMLPCGMSTLLDKQIDLLGATRLSLWVRPELAEFTRTQVIPNLKIPATVNQPLDDEPALITTGRTLHFANFETPAEPAVVVEENDLIRFAFVRDMAGLSIDDVFNRSQRWLSLLELPRAMPQARFIDGIWDLITWNEEALISDSIRWRGCTSSPGDGPWHVVNSDDVCLGEKVKLSPGCVLDASRGPIVLDAGVSIGANAVIEGPVYIGQFSRVTPLSLIRGGTTIGKMCKVGGEVSNSIISSYTNKAHDGFLGDSFLGSWVNFGAGTTTSNLKNTYGEVNFRIGSRELKTGRMMLGSIVGDHTKTAVGTRLNTGSYVGYSCMLAGPGLTPKFVPSFTFWTDRGGETYRADNAAAVARRMYGRRDLSWEKPQQDLMDYAAKAAKEVEK